MTMKKVKPSSLGCLHKEKGKTASDAKKKERRQALTSVSSCLRKKGDGSITWLPGTSQRSYLPAKKKIAASEEQSRLHLRQKKHPVRAAGIFGSWTNVLVCREKGKANAITSKALAREKNGGGGGGGNVGHNKIYKNLALGGEKQLDIGLVKLCHGPQLERAKGGTPTPKNVRSNRD